MPRIFQSVSSESAMFARIEADRRLRASARQRATAAQAQAVAANYDAYPHMPPGVALSLGQAGHGPESPVVQEVAQATAKENSGFGWHTLGDVVSAAGRVADIGLLNFDEMATGALKPAVRAAATIAETPLQEGLAVARATIAAGGSPLSSPNVTWDEWTEKYNQSNTSTGRVTLNQILAGNGVDAGSGWLPGGTVQETYKQQSAGLKFQGTNESITFGRYVAREIFEPGSRPYDVMSGAIDFGTQVFADPANIVGAGAGKAVRARKLLTVPQAALKDAGAVNGLRRTVLSEVADPYLTSKEGRGIVRAFTDEQDFDTLWNKTNKKLGTKLTADLADARTEDEVINLLRPELGIAVREKPTYGGFTYTTHKLFDNVRLAQMMPGQYLDLEDADRAVEQLDRFLRNAKVERGTIADLNGKMARATTRSERFNVLEEAMSSTKGALTAHGVPANRARGMTTMFTDSVEELRRYAVNEIGENMAIPGAVINDAGQALPSPHLLVELVNRTVPLPDARDIRRVTSRYKRLFDNGAVKMGTSAIDAIQNDLWKRMTLLRGAYSVRVLGEEQIRMAGAGIDSSIAHPLSYIAWVTGRKGAKGLTGEDFKDASAAAADLDEFGRAMGRRWAGWITENQTIATKHKTLYSKDADEYTAAWADEIMQLRSDPVAQAVAQMPDSLDDVRRSFWDGPLSPVRKELAKANAALRDPNASNAYIDSVWERIRVKTGTDPDLTDAIATGRFRGEPLRVNEAVNKKFVSALEQIVDVGPLKVKGDLMVHAKGPMKPAVEAYDNVTRYLFSAIMGRPTNYLSRSNTFKQAYWSRAEELLPFMDEASQQLAIRAAEDANISSSVVNRMRKAAAKVSGDLTLDEADTVAKGFGLDRTHALLMDLTQRSQFFDAARLVIPFGEAWKEVLTSWAKLGISRPQNMRRAQQAVSGARGSGWFYSDPATGEEVFNYPGSEWASQALVGVPVPLVGRVAGLSMMTSVLPGVGPVVQVPAGWLIPDTPEYDRVRNVIFPFGETDTKGGFLEAFLPAWVQKWRTATEFASPEQQRMFANTTMDVARYLASTGEYNTNSPEEMARLLEDAKEAAQDVQAFRSAAQFFAPSAPSPRFLAMDKNGDVMTAQVLLDDYRQLQEEDFNSATQRFLEKYGEQALLFMQGKSASVGAGAPVSKEGNDWVRSHPDVVEKYSNVYGVFAPEGEGFDYTAYTRQFETGERDPLTPEQALRLANNRVAAMQYNNAKDLVGDRPTDEQSAWLRELKRALIEDYPGYEDQSGITQKAETPSLIRELERAVEDPDLADAPGSDSIRTYLDARAQAQESAEASGLAGFAGKGKSARPIRDWLRAVGEALTEEDPGFVRAWEYVLSRELPDEEETA